MTKKKVFSDTTQKKAQAFLEEFQKNPTQPVEPLCAQMHLGKSQLYEYLRVNNLSLAGIRASPVTSLALKPMTKTAGELPMEEVRKVIAHIDELRTQKGLQLEDALKKAMSPDIKTVGKYYYYKNKLGAKKRSYVKKEKKIETIPTAHTIVEYIEKPAKKKPELLMMLGSAEALLDFVKKMQGV